MYVTLGRLFIGGTSHTTTGERDLKRAHAILVEANVRKKMNAAPITRRFRDVAKHAIKRMDTDTASGNGKASNRDYKIALERYLIPILGNYHVDNIDYAALEKLDTERDLRMRKTPTRSASHKLQVELVL